MSHLDPPCEPGCPTCDPAPQPACPDCGTPDGRPCATWCPTGGTLHDDP